jgi:plasmid maintenance system antidote protein VapI
MTDRLAFILSGEDIDQLAEHVGVAWVERFTDTSDSRSDAITQLCDAIDELTDSRHRSRADGRGCTCGWNGRDLLAHLRDVRRRQQIEALAAVDVTVEQPDIGVFPVAIDRYDWSRPPGRLLKTWGDAGNLTDEDVAALCDLPLDVYRGIVAGSEQITTEIARRLEKGTSTFPANVWLMLERHYRAALVERARQPH